MRIKRLGKFEFRLEAGKERISKLRESFEEVLGKVFERKEMWKLDVKRY